MDHLDKIFGLDGLNPLLIPDVIQVVMESSQLSVADLKICRQVCSDWLPPATAALSQKSRISIESDWGEMAAFTQMFIPGQLIPSKHFKLFKTYNWNYEHWEDNEIDNFMTEFQPLLDWPGLEIKSVYLCRRSKQDVGSFLDQLSTLLQKTGYLEHLGFQYWKIQAPLIPYFNNEIIKDGSNIKSVALHNCELSENSADIILASFFKAFPNLESIDFSNPYRYTDRFSTKIRAETLLSSVSVSWSNIETLKIPELNSWVIDQLSQTDVKLKHFHADVVCTQITSPAAWTSFLTQQNELESFSINNMNLKEYSVVAGYLDYEFPRMEKLRRLHIGGNHSILWEEMEFFALKNEIKYSNLVPN